MHISQLQITNYRNYISAEISFEPGVNIIYGANANGKTNLIEAIYMCATSKSHRLTKDSDIVRLGEGEGHVHLEFFKDGVDEVIDLHLNAKGKKAIAVNQMKVHKLSDLFGMLHVIMFSPEDLGLIKNGPKERRRFIDMELSQLNPVYMYYLSQYHKALKQRNKVLKDGKADLLEAFDDQLKTYGTRIITMRRDFIEALDPMYHEKHLQISGGKENVHLIYEMNVTEEGYGDKLKSRRERDMALKTTSVGPHRDDLKFAMGEMDLRKFGSQGQQRTAALSLKLSEIDLVRQQIDDTPVLLLDDVLSELDHQRQQFLTSHLEELQTFITCTGVEDFVTSQMNKYQLYEVLEGQVKKMT